MLFTAHKFTDFYMNPLIIICILFYLSISMNQFYFFNPQNNLFMIFYLLDDILLYTIPTKCRNPHAGILDMVHGEKGLQQCITDARMTVILTRRSFLIPYPSLS